MDYETLLQHGATIAKLIADQKANIEAAKGVLSATEIGSLRDQLKDIHAKAMDVSADLDAALEEAEKRG